MGTPAKSTNGRWHTLAIRGEIWTKLVDEAKKRGESAQGLANKQLQKSLKVKVGKLA